MPMLFASWLLALEKTLEKRPPELPPLELPAAPEALELLSAWLLLVTALAPPLPFVSMRARITLDSKCMTMP